MATPEQTVSLAYNPETGRYEKNVPISVAEKWQKQTEQAQKIQQQQYKSGQQVQPLYEISKGLAQSQGKQYVFITPLSEKGEPTGEPKLAGIYSPTEGIKPVPEEFKQPIEQVYKQIPQNAIQPSIDIVPGAKPGEYLVGGTYKVMKPAEAPTFFEGYKKVVDQEEYQKALALLQKQGQMEFGAIYKQVLPSGEIEYVGIPAPYTSMEEYEQALIRMGRIEKAAKDWMMILGHAWSAQQLAGALTVGQGIEAWVRTLRGEKDAFQKLGERWQAERTAMLTEWIEAPKVAAAKAFAPPAILVTSVVAPYVLPAKVLPYYQVGMGMLGVGTGTYVMIQAAPKIKAGEVGSVAEYAFGAATAALGATVIYKGAQRIFGPLKPGETIYQPKMSQTKELVQGLEMQEKLKTGEQTRMTFYWGKANNIKFIGKTMQNQIELPGVLQAEKTGIEMFRRGNLFGFSYTFEEKGTIFQIADIYKITGVQKTLPGTFYGGYGVFPTTEVSYQRIPVFSWANMKMVGKPIVLGDFEAGGKLFITTLSTYKGEGISVSPEGFSPAKIISIVVMDSEAFTSGSGGKGVTILAPLKPPGVPSVAGVTSHLTPEWAKAAGAVTAASGYAQGLTQGSESKIIEEEIYIHPSIAKEMQSQIESLDEKLEIKQVSPIRVRFQAQLQAQTQIQSQIQSQARIQSQAQAQAQTQVRIQSQIQTQVQSQAQAQAQARIQAQAQAQALKQLQLSISTPTTTTTRVPTETTPPPTIPPIPRIKYVESSMKGMKIAKKVEMQQYKKYKPSLYAYHFKVKEYRPSLAKEAIIRPIKLKLPKLKVKR